MVGGGKGQCLEMLTSEAPTMLISGGVSGGGDLGLTTKAAGVTQGSRFV